MDYIISSSKLRNKDIEIVCGKDTLSGVRKIAAKVSGDIKAVFGTAPSVVESSKCKSPILVGLAGDKLIKASGIDVSDIEGKREVYKIEVKDSSLVITGSAAPSMVFSSSPRCWVSPLSSTGST